MRRNLIILLLSKGDKETIEEAKEEYNRVPRLLKEKVKKLLIDAGMEEITE